MVDFRDRDSIMTPFEYDTDPLGLHLSDPAPYTGISWRVDGVIGIDPNTGLSDDLQPFLRLVLGMQTAGAFNNGNTGVS